MMKKLLSLATLLLLALSASAQDITGKWKGSFQDEGKTVPFTMTFNAKGTVNVNITTQDSDPEIGTIHLSVKVGGTYKVTDKVLSVTLNPKKYSAEVTKIDFNNQLKVAILAQPGMDREVLNMVNEQLRNSTDNMTEDIPFSGDINIKELTAKKLVLSKDKDTFVLTK